MLASFSSLSRRMLASVWSYRKKIVSTRGHVDSWVWSWVSGRWLLERDFAAEFFKCVFLFFLALWAPLAECHLVPSFKSRQTSPRLTSPKLSNQDPNNLNGSISLRLRGKICVGWTVPGVATGLETIIPPDGAKVRKIEILHKVIQMNYSWSIGDQLT